MAFTKTYNSFRSVDTLHSDTLRRVAMRELGDASRWSELAAINNLLPPYITDNPDEAGSRVILSGGAIKVPAKNQRVSATDDPGYVFGSDVSLNRGKLSANNGDLAIVSGVPNLTQALRNVIVTEPGDLMFHPRYGCSVRSMRGRKNIQKQASIAAAYVKRSLNADPRISSVPRASVRVNGDVMEIEADAMAVDGKKITAKVDYGISG